MKSFDISAFFLKQIASDDDMSPAIAAMKALMESLRLDDSTTLQEFIEKMKDAREALSKTDVSVVSVSSGCELFLRFITLSHKELEQAADFASCREILLRRGEDFIKSMQESRRKILRSSNNLIKDGMVILTHSRSRNVLAVMTEAARQGRQFTVFVTESQPDCSGHRVADDLRAVGIPCTVILDAAVGYIMERVSAVMVGAEGVCENGGILNKHRASVLNSGSDLIREHPLVDYTPPENLTLLYTDLGVLPTSAITEHLIKLYT
ncbi:Translation initiation factor eIF-2B subunit alpha-like [Homarus americanus]|uniref:Translation initiation factor eIF2B subunit alpha n=1 Tax=Homarus americanus TaxID=6706 RepID=A0A8J5JG54_HOMAM|nr:Translation initiation factor eIF-2B subunit alpha-like [Homarus americanus]